MAAASNRRDLFISVNGSVTGLAATMKAGRSLLHDFGSDSVNVLELVEQKLGDVGKGGLPGLKQVEQTFDATFKRIRGNAEAVLNAPSGQAAVQIWTASPFRRWTRVSCRSGRSRHGRAAPTR